MALSTSFMSSSRWKSSVGSDHSVEEDDMTEVTSCSPGTLSYVDLATSNLDAAKSFYTALFGWDTEDAPMPYGGVYTSFSRNGKTVAGGYTMSPEMAELGVPPHWTTCRGGSDSIHIIEQYFKDGEGRQGRRDGPAR